MRRGSCIVLPDPPLGLAALGRVLRPNGTLAIMVYGKYGRTGVYMLQEMFRLLGLHQDEEGVATVRETLAAMPQEHPVRGYLTRSRDLEFDAGIVDSFLHQRDRAYSVAECLALTEQARLHFMGFRNNFLYYPDGQLGWDTELYRRVNALPERRIWQFMELYTGLLGQHAFCVCHPSRPAKSYKIDFAASSLLDCLPVLRCKEVPLQAGAAAGAISLRREPAPAVFTFPPDAAALIRQIDGGRSIKECAARSGVRGAKPEDVELLCRQTFERLWRLGFVFLRIAP